MAIICSNLCTIPTPASLPTGAGACTVELRSGGVKRFGLIKCSYDTSLLLPSANTPDAIYTSMSAAWAASDLFVSPTGILTAFDQEDPTKIKLDDCGGSEYVKGSTTITMEFRKGWNDGTPAGVEVQQYGEEVFFNTVDDNGNSYNFFLVNCDNEVEFLLDPKTGQFATGVISIVDNQEEVNDCYKIRFKVATINFDCGARRTRVIKIDDPAFADLAAWL